MQDNFDDVLSTPLGTENISPVRSETVNAPTPGADEVISQTAANNRPEKIVPVWVYFSFASVAVMSVVYWFKHLA